MGTGPNPGGQGEAAPASDPAAAASLSPEQPPPAAESTAAPPEPQPGGYATREVKPARSELTEPFDKNWEAPRPTTLATQEIRLALAFTGGVSLAVWMGGVARELDLLVQASDMRRTPTDPADATTPDPVVPPDRRDGKGTDDGLALRDDEVRRRYRRLLDLVDAQVAVDVLAGTSAGGINAALLGLVNARGLSLEKLRDIWLDAGAFDKLLRDPKEQVPPSLLKGDGQMLTALSKGIRDIVGGRPPAKKPRVTDVFVTTTLLSPETSTFSDDYGTVIVDSDHHGLFHFDQRALNEPAIQAPLALAARSSASFPGAFEPSFIRFGGPDGTPVDPAHPDMGDWSNTSRSHWAADGGLLVNRPIAPLLQTVFDRPADRQVRRALLYIVPSSGPAAAPPEARQSEPLPLAVSLVSDLTSTLNQSIAADLAAIKEHNDRTRAVTDTRLRLVDLANRLGDDDPLADSGAWTDYRVRQGAWLVAPLVSEVTRQIATRPARPAAWQAAPEQDQDAVLHERARAEVTGTWPVSLPPAGGAVAGAAALGRPAFDSAKATLLRLLRLGTQLATSAEQRTFLAVRGMYAHQALEEIPGTDLRTFVRRGLSAAGAETTLLPDLVATLAGDHVQPPGGSAAFGNAWESLAETFRRSFACLTELAAAAPAEPIDADVAATRAAVAGELSSYLRFFRVADDPGRFRVGGELVRRLLDLHVAVRSVLPVLQEVEQRVELIQVSADTRTELDLDRGTPERKLTGMQLSHFGAFYKASWRANDWMWGRLDGCGWLVHVLLDPRRIMAVLQNDEIDPEQRTAEFVTRLEEALDAKAPPEVAAALRFLSDGSQPPRSLPEVALWAASALQSSIAAKELSCVAAQLREEAKSDRLSESVAAWLTSTEGVPWRSAPAAQVAELLRTCPVPAETLAEERDRGTGTFLRTSAHTIAVATSAATGLKKPPASLRPTFATARTITRGAYVAIDRTGGQWRKALLVGAGLFLVGLLASFTGIGWLEAAGLAGMGIAVLMLALSLNRKRKDVAGAVVVGVLIVLAFAPLIDALWNRITSWLTKTAIPGIHDHPWIWPVVLFVVLLPPFMLVLDLVRLVAPGKPVAAAEPPPPPPPPPPGPGGPAGAVPAGLPSPRPGSPGPVGEPVGPGEEGANEPSA